MDSLPEPGHDDDDEGQEDRFERNPDLGETTVLVDYGEVQVLDVANIQVHLHVAVDGNSNV